MGRVVAIVGRPNVGKSTLFNRLTGTHEAIVDEIAGVTRDRNYGKVEWQGFQFSLIDTGGYVLGSEDVFEEEICKQVNFAIEEADLIMFMVDVTTGITHQDEVIANLLRRAKKPIVLIANKVDNPGNSYEASEFFSLGLGEVFTISAITGSQSGDLLDEVVKHLSEHGHEEAPDLPKYAVVGRPNVGKSTLINALLGTERNIVTPVAGTTRDSIYTRYNKFGHDFFLIDTAGLRKRTKVHEDLEFYSVMRSVNTIERADVCIMLIDATEGLQSQDQNIFHLIVRNNKGVVIVVNKWDIMEKDTDSVKEYTEKIHKEIAPFVDVPIVFVSALSKQRIIKVLEEAQKVYENRTRKIPTSKLNNVMLPIIEALEPPMYKGKLVRIKYVSQLPTHYPTFAFFCNLPQYIKESYKRFLENKLRENFDFKGVPIQVYMRKK